MRECLFKLGRLGLLLDFAVVGFGVVTTIDHVRTGSSQQNGGAALVHRAETLAHVLLRCSQLGPAAGDCPNCQANWEENRNSFWSHVPPVVRAVLKTRTTP